MIADRKVTRAIIFNSSSSRALALKSHPKDVQNFLIRKLPIQYQFDSYYEPKGLKLADIKSLFVENGVSSEQMKEWVLA